MWGTAAARQDVAHVHSQDGGKAKPSFLRSSSLLFHGRLGPEEESALRSNTLLSRDSSEGKKISATTPEPGGPRALTTCMLV